MSRLRAETMPAVTVPPRLNGLPIAITHSPSRSFSESPNFTALSGLSDLTRSSAMSVFWSLPIELGLEPRAVVEDDGDLVGLRDDVVVGDHDARRIDDEARAQRVDRGAGCARDSDCRPAGRGDLKKSRRIPRTADRRQLRRRRRSRDSTFCEVEMLTTASITFSATSAMASGPRATEGAGSAGRTIAAARPRPRSGGGPAAQIGRECRAWASELHSASKSACFWGFEVRDTAPVRAGTQGRSRHSRN